MPRVHLVSVGTSLLRNATRDLELDRAPKDADLDNYLASAAPETVSAENNALNRELEPGDGVTFFHSHTPDGEQCAQALHRHYDRLGHRAEAVLIPELRVERTGRGFERGLRNFVQLLTRHITAARKEGQAVLVNATGGFKAQTGLATLVGMLNQVPVYYIFETQSHNVFLPPLPVGWDVAFRTTYGDVLDWLVETPRPRDEIAQRIIGRTRTRAFWNLVQETEDGRLELSLTGWAVAEVEPPEDEPDPGPRVLLSSRARASYRQSAGKTRKRFDELLRLIAEPGWSGRLHQVGGGSVVAPANRGGQHQNDDERIAFALRGNDVLVCELFPHHMEGTPEGRLFNRMKGEGFDPDAYEAFEPLPPT